MLACTILMAWSCVSGCAHSPLYDENRDKKAQETQQAVTDAHVAGVVASLEKSFADVAAREEQNARDRQTYLFDLEVQSVSSATSLASKYSDKNKDVDGLITVLSARLAVLGVSDPDHAKLDAKLTAIRHAVADLNADRGALNVTFAEFRGTIGHQFASCSEVYAASADPATKSNVPTARFLNANPGKRAVLVKAKFAALIEACKAVDADLDTQLKQYGGGLVKSLNSHVADLNKQLSDYEQSRRHAQEDVDNAVKAFDVSSAKAAAQTHASKSEAVQKGAQSALDMLGAVVGNGDPAAAHVVAEEKLRRLEEILSAIAATPSDGKVQLTRDEQVSVAAVRDLPALADEADKLLADAAKPRLVPFLAAIDHQKLVLQGFEAAQQAKQKQLLAALSQLQAGIGESAALARVLQPLTHDAKWATQSIAALEKSLTPEEKVRLHRALATYDDEVQQLRIDAAVWLVRERAAQYEEGLAQSKSVAAEWDGLMDTVAKVLADYHAAGIKRSEIAEFFKALGLVSIGVGVAL
jgi:hypothetical protein